MSLLVDTISIIALIIAASIHEVAHGYVAYKLGDPTAKNAGRLTLNPLKHIDPVGSVLLPALFVLSGSGIFFAYAKPVPYNPYRLKNPGKDDALVALAGPVSNLIQALIGLACWILALGLYDTFVPGYQTNMMFDIVSLFFLRYWVVNIYLMIFNLIPLPPLDGSKLLFPLLKGKAKESYYQVQQYAMPIFFIAILILPRLFHIDPVGWILSNTAGRLIDLGFTLAATVLNGGLL